MYSTMVEKLLQLSKLYLVSNSNVASKRRFFHSGRRIGKFKVVAIEVVKRGLIKGFSDIM